MQKRLLISLVSLISSIYVFGYSPRDILQNTISKDKLKEVLVLNQEWVPYPDYYNREGWNNLLSSDKDHFIKQGEKRLKYEWKVVPATAYIEFERSGNRRIMEDPFGQNNNAIASLLMAELAEGKGRFIDQLINGVYHACEMTSWALSAHLSGPQESHRSLPDNKRHIIDLTSGDLSSLLSWVHYFFSKEFDKINPTISERIRHELKERTIDAYLNNNDFWWMAIDYKEGMMINNWNPWCNFNVLQTLLLMENDNNKLANGVWKTMISVDKFINYTHSDGACEEGPSYWGHAAGKMYDYLKVLERGTNGNISIFNEDIIKNMGEYIANSYIGNGWVVNFADASAKGGGNAHLIYNYGRDIKSNQMMGFASYLNNRSNNLSAGRDIFRTLEALSIKEELRATSPHYKASPFVWYPETEFCYMTNKNGYFVAAKGGYNNESHNHNDIGTFSLYIDTVPIFIDAGVGTYTRQTFSSERYSIWTMQSRYHNIPEINGVSQAFGSQYKSTDAKFDKKKMEFSLNLANAYPQEAEIKGWNRTYRLNNDKLIIKDSFELNKSNHKNEVNFLTWGDIDISQPGIVKIHTSEVSAQLEYDKKSFDIELEAIALDDKRLSDIWGDNVYRITLKEKVKNRKANYTYTVKRI